MKKWLWAGSAAIALGASLAIAQDAPESLLPPGFDDPAPAPSPSPAPRPTQAPATPADPAAPAAPGIPTVQPLPVGPGDGEQGPAPDLSRLPSLEELESMSTDELDELLGLKPKFDIPPAARRSLERVGILAPSEGGLPTGSLASQPASLVRAILQGTDGPLVSRWGHILLRRALASRLAAPEGMNPVEFAALRANVLNSMGEHAAARAIAQDIDTSNWDNALTDAALDAYVGTADIVGACPAVRLSGTDRDDAFWSILQSICAAYAGEESQAGRQLDRALRREEAPRIDLLLAQRYAGAAGRGRRAVEIEWEGVEELNPWRAALANAVGEEIPEGLRDDAGAYYERSWATAPMLPLAERARSADRAAREGILSADAMVDLYSQIYVTEGIEGDAALTASLLRDGYVAETGADRFAAIESIWGGTDEPDYGRMVLTAYAAARLPVTDALASSSDNIIASILTAGLDRDAENWLRAVPQGSLAWAQIAAARPGDNRIASREDIDAFIDDDDSSDYRKSHMMLASLAGLGRIAQGDLNDFVGRTELNLSRESRWSRAIIRAAEVDNRALVAMLAGLGMQGESWSQMTPRHLYHIVSALNRVGLGAEARMIAAEAIARG